MTTPSIFDEAEQALSEPKPFVLYRKNAFPSDTNFVIRGFFQKEDQLHTVEDFTESGFVMAPFDMNGKSILFPTRQTEKMEENMPRSMKIYPSAQSLPHKKEEKEFHLDLVTQGIEAICQQELKKVVLSRKLQVPTNRNPIAIFRRLLQFYPSAFVYCWFHPKVGLWLGATPETLLKVTGKTVKTMALAGTKSAKNNPQPEWTAKEIEEQQLVTDFIDERLRDKVHQLNIGPVENIRAGNLWHLKCDLSGRLEKMEHLKPILESLHPTPAVCGLPKDASKQFIKDHENYNREFYTGFIGELNLREKYSRRANRRNIEQQAYAPMRQKTELFVNLRCMQYRKNSCEIYVGGGIVKDSKPVSEWEETVNKSRTMLDAL